MNYQLTTLSVAMSHLWSSGNPAIIKIPGDGHLILLEILRPTHGDPADERQMRVMFSERTTVSVMTTSQVRKLVEQDGKVQALLS